MIRAIPLGLLLCLCGAARADEGQGWKTVRDKDGFQFATRHVGFSKVDEVRAVSTVAYPIDRVAAVLSDVEHYPNNMPPTELVRRLRGDAQDGTYYVELKPPMCSRRYYCVRYQVQRDSATQVRVVWSTHNDSCPARAGGPLRMDDNAGSWTLTALDAGHTRVIYQAHVDPGGSLPASFVNWGTPNAISDLFAALRKATQSQMVTARN